MSLPFVDEATEQDWQGKIAGCGIPPHMAGGIVRWIMYRIAPGDFLCAIIKNDLRDACARADDTNRFLLWNYCNFFYNYAPSPCWGSPAHFEDWRRKE